jgi:predicted Fe-Mo cluster-binding NifX family protein
VQTKHGKLARMLLSPTPMRVALPVWKGRISPVFDVATQVRVIEVEDGTPTSQRDLRLAYPGRVARLEELGIDVLICAAVSRPLEAACWVAGIEVVSEVCGPVDAVIEAYLDGSLEEGGYVTPGRASHRRPSADLVGPPKRTSQTTAAHTGRHARHH